MSFPIEAEAVALAQVVQRHGCTADRDAARRRSSRDRPLTCVDNATDAHWVLVAKMLQAAEAEEEPCP